jgi:hypothetical protein
MKYPTAKHELVDVHDTLSKLSRIKPAGLAVGWSSQSVPFQIAAKVALG